MITIFSYVSMTSIIMMILTLFLGTIYAYIDSDKYSLEDLEIKDPCDVLVKWSNGRFTGICKILRCIGFIWYCCLAYSIIWVPVWVPVVLLIEEYSHITIPVMPIILILFCGIIFDVFCFIIVNEIEYILFLWKSGPLGRICASGLVILSFVIVYNLK